MKNKMNLNIQLDNKNVSYSKDMPEILRKYFTNMETTIETMIQLTNNGEFYDVKCEFAPNDDNLMLFIFEGRELRVKISTPVKKETLIIKEEFCMLRNKIYHSFIKNRKIKYIIKTKPVRLYSEHYKFFDSENLVFDLSFGYNIINYSDFCNFLREEKRLLNNEFNIKNVKKYSEFKSINIIEAKDIYGECKETIGLTDIINNEKQAEQFDKIILEDDLEDLKNNLDEIDDLMYQTGILSLSEIKEALEKTEA